MFLAAFDGFYFHFCNSLKISIDYYEYNFECDLLKSKRRTSVSLKVSNFKGWCNIEIALIQIKWKWCYRLSDIGFFPIFVLHFSLHTPRGKAPHGKGQGLLLGQNPPPLYPPLLEPLETNYCSCIPRVLKPLETNYCSCWVYPGPWNPLKPIIVVVVYHESWIPRN